MDFLLSKYVKFLEFDNIDLDFAHDQCLLFTKYHIFNE